MAVGVRRSPLALDASTEHPQSLSEAAAEGMSETVPKMPSIDSGATPTVAIDNFIKFNINSDALVTD